MSQPRQFGDTTYRKIFVGGLAWETRRETMRRYFEQFGEIQEAVVITDKETGRSKGYGFVTFRDPEAAMRACQDPSPMIDGRRANCNLASLAAPRSRPSTLRQGFGRFRSESRSIRPAYPATSSPYYQQPRQYPWYSGYSQENMYQMGVYGGNQFPPYYPGNIQSFYPYYAQYMAQYPYLPQQYATATLSPLTSASSTATGVTAVAASGSPSQAGEGPFTAEQQDTSA